MGRAASFEITTVPFTQWSLPVNLIFGSGNIGITQNKRDGKVYFMCNY